MRYRQATYDEPLLFDIPAERIERVDLGAVPEKLRREGLDIPDLEEFEVVRHYTRLSQMNFGVDSGFYPLGSCTMKYSPKVCEEVASWRCAGALHPGQDEGTVQGALQVMYELQDCLASISGMDAVSLQPAAGAQGEFTGLLIARAFHESRGQKRTQVVLPDTAHGTNPASAAMAGFEVVEIPSKNGCIDLDALKTALSDRTAAFMLTNPNTLGLFESEVLKIAKMVHDAGALLYYDGANLNAIMGKTSPGRMGFDIVHFNLHKTFSTPHGGGGPGSGPVAVKRHLRDFLPVPMVGSNEGRYFLDYSIPSTIGKVKSFYGNFGVLLRAYVYIKSMGRTGLTRAVERAVLNSNYLKTLLDKDLEVPFNDKPRKHEFVLSGKSLKERGLKTLDVAKRLLDYGYHAPTIYFPLIVEEAMMVEPTETESKRTLDGFAEALKTILKEDVETVKSAPQNTAVGRVDEVAAARKLILSWKQYRKKGIT